MPALTFNDAPLGLPAQHTPPVHQVLSVSPDHSKGDPFLWGRDKMGELVYYPQKGRGRGVAVLCGERK